MQTAWSLHCARIGQGRVNGCHFISQTRPQEPRTC